MRAPCTQHPPDQPATDTPPSPADPRAHTSLCELLMLGIAAAAADASSFPMLVYASFGAVLAANLLFRSWARRAQPSVDLAIASVEGA